MNLGDFLDALRLRQPRAISTGLPKERTTELLGGRVAIMLSGGFPEGYGLTGVSITKGPSDASLCRNVESQAATLNSHPAFAPLAGYSAAELTGRVAFVIRDASPDSLLAALLLLLHLANVEGANAALEPWLDSVTHWDQGQMPEQPFHSWPALASTLSHARFPMAVARENTPGSAREDNPLQVAWDQSFRFLVDSLHAGLDPERMPSSMSGAGGRAINAMRRLRQLYAQTLTHATMLQLSVPLTGAPDRRVTVDALVYVEDEPSDSVKIFGRVDRTRASSGEGFKLALSCRPAAPPFNRFTVHAVPTEGLDLTDLWTELERRETEAYRKRDGSPIMRPADAAAPSASDFLAGRFQELDSLPVGLEGPRSFQSDHLDQLGAKRGCARKLANVNNIWCNPWYLNPDANLIGSPGKDADNADADPSLLTWEQVIDSLFTVFHPLAGIQVDARQADGARRSVELLEAPPMQFALPHGSPVLRYLYWPRGAVKATATRGVTLNDSNVRVLGAVAGQPEVAGRVSLPDLPPRAACRLVMLNGGFAVLSHGGCVVIDDWTDLQLHDGDIVDALHKATAWQQQLEEHVLDLARFNATVSELAVNQWRESASYQLLGNLAAARHRLVTQRVAAAAASITDTNARVLSQELRTFWGLTDRETHVDEGYDRIERSVKALQDARSSQLLRYLAIFGFPAFIAGNLSKPLTYFINELLVSNGVIWRSDALGMRSALLMMGEALSWMVCTALLAFVLNLIYRRLDPTPK